MTSVSARSYVAAGLATAIAGVAVASPVLAQSNFHLPTASGNVELASEVSTATQHALSAGAVEVKQIGDAVRHVMASAPHGAATAATTLPGGPLVEKAAVTAVVRAVTAVVAANPAGAVTVHRNSASSPAAAAALPNLPTLGGILAIPVLVADIPLDVVANTLQVLANAAFDVSDIAFGLSTGNQDETQIGIKGLESDIPDGINNLALNVDEDVQAIKKALGLDTAAAERAAVAGATKAAAAKNPGAVAVDPKSPTRSTPNDPTKADPTKADPTKGTHATKGTDPTKGDTSKPSHSSKPGHTGAATVKDAGDKGATKAGASTHNGHTPGAASHPGGSAAKHPAGAGAGAGAKKGGGTKGGK